MNADGGSLKSTDLCSNTSNLIPLPSNHLNRDYHSRRANLEIMPFFEAKLFCWIWGKSAQMLNHLQSRMGLTQILPSFFLFFFLFPILKKWSNPLLLWPCFPTFVPNSGRKNTVLLCLLSKCSVITKLVPFWMNSFLFHSCLWFSVHSSCSHCQSSSQTLWIAPHGMKNTV